MEVHHRARVLGARGACVASRRGRDLFCEAFAVWCASSASRMPFYCRDRRSSRAEPGLAGPSRVGPGRLNKRYSAVVFKRQVDTAKNNGGGDTRRPGRTATVWRRRGDGTAFAVHEVGLDGLDRRSVACSAVRVHAVVLAAAVVPPCCARIDEICPCFTCGVAGIVSARRHSLNPRIGGLLFGCGWCLACPGRAPAERGVGSPARTAALPPSPRPSSQGPRDEGRGRMPKQTERRGEGKEGRRDGHLLSVGA